MTGMLETKSNETPTNDILSGLNYLNECKKSGADFSDTFSRVIVKLGELLANQISRGKMDDEEIESVESFILNNGNDYFSHNHKGIEPAFKMLTESIDMASYENERKNKTVDHKSYEKGLKL